METMQQFLFLYCFNDPFLSIEGSGIAPTKEKLFWGSEGDFQLKNIKGVCRCIHPRGVGEACRKGIRTFALTTRYILPSRTT
jgi:hypothetical protein